MTTTTTEIQVSPRIVKLVEKFADAVIRMGDVQTDIHDLAKQIVEQSKEDGLSKAQLRDLIVEALSKKGCSERTIRRYLPATLKNQRMRELGQKGNEAKQALRSSAPAQSEILTVQPALGTREMEPVMQQVNDLESELATAKAKIKTYENITRNIRKLIRSYSPKTAVRMNVLSEKLFAILDNKEDADL